MLFKLTLTNISILKTQFTDFYRTRKLLKSPIINVFFCQNVWRMNRNEFKSIMKDKNKSPKINSIKWGQIITDKNIQYKDAKLFPGGSRKWDWNETGTHHVPGIQPADVEELLDHGAKTIVLSKGFHERLQVCDETTDLLKDQEIEFFILQTERAVEKYNELCDHQAVGALIHSTC